MATGTKCATCAFRPGTEANANGVTLMLARLCIENAEDFYCHENALPDGLLPEGEAHLCAGFIEGVTAMNARGFYTTDPQWKRDVRAALMEVIGQCVDDNKAGIPFDEAVYQERVRKQFELIQEAA